MVKEHEQAANTGQLLGAVRFQREVRLRPSTHRVAALVMALHARHSMSLRTHMPQHAPHRVLERSGWGMQHLSAKAHHGHTAP